VQVAKTNLGYTIIRSPIDGIVVARNVDVGQTVAASLQAPTLFNIAQDLTKMQVDTQTDESDVGNIKVGQESTFTVDAYPNQTFRGKVVQIRLNPTTVQNVVTYDTIVNFDNPQMKLFPGMTAYVSIPVAAVKDVVKVPNAALRYTPDLPPEKAQELYRKYGIQAQPRSEPVHQASAQSGGAHAQTKSAAPIASDAAIVWKLLPDHSLEPVQVRVGLTDHTYTALVAGNVAPGEELVTGAATAKAGPSGLSVGGGQRR
jgi:HlyD family secretion protein